MPLETKSLNKIIVESPLESYLTRKFRSFHSMFKIWSSKHSRLFIHYSLPFLVLCLKWINKRMLNISTSQWRIILILAEKIIIDPQSIKKAFFTTHQMLKCRLVEQKLTLSSYVNKFNLFCSKIITKFESMYPVLIIVLMHKHWKKLGEISG